ncbi:integrase [Geothrix limicola]|uniref:Integrase n=1 Tax=Geothrix limicola TaxID=2927978 RepID=A0ABQ5QIC0_9BACT|nr:site-specific integrase [Geothrix limicola]GLH74115.1 integrase [Geothrix limicola]
METVKLTDTRVRSIQPGKVIVRRWDSVVAGFYVRVHPGGARSYAIQFQRPSGSKVQVTIGSADVWTAEAAREQARKLREVHDAGKDARAHLQGERNSKDVTALVKVWKDDYRAKLKPSTQRSHDSIIKTVILPAVGTRLVKDLDRSSIKDLYRREAKKHPTQANRTIEILSKLMSIAEDEGWRPLQSNPCFRFPKQRLQTCKRILTAAELGRLESSMHSLEEAGKLDRIAADLIRFLALSGLRAGEAGNLRWQDVNLDQGTMTFHDHKTSVNKGAKVLPLNAPLRTILKRRAGDRLGNLVFPGLVKDRPIQGLRHMWLRILAVENCELGEATPHDLRRTFMSVSVELGYPPAIGDTLLGHSLGKIQDVYTRLSMDGILRNASEDTSAWIAAALRGENPKSGTKILTAEAKQA